MNSNCITSLQHTRSLSSNKLRHDQGCHWMRIIHGYQHSNLSPTRIRILFFQIRQYPYPYPQVEGWVLDNDIHVEKSILQQNETIDFDILSQELFGFKKVGGSEEVSFSLSPFIQILKKKNEKTLFLFSFPFYTVISSVSGYYS